MQRPERSTYTPLDFLNWREQKSLVLAPKFQRGRVWTTAARSYFIDTMIRGMPAPPIYLRITQNLEKTRIIREVVDGQQRVAAVMDFMDDKYALSRTLGSPYAARWFSDLDEEQQDAIRQFGFICEILHGISDKEVVEIFARLNTYSVPLNAQELRHGRFFGYFRQSAYTLAQEHIEFWRRHAIFSERMIARMKDAELASELMIAALDGMQDKKKSIDNYYGEYDEDFPSRQNVETRFRTTVSEIDEALGDTLRNSEFNRPPLFYSLYCVLYHRLFGLPKQQLATPRKRLSLTERKGLTSAVIELSDKVAAARQNQRVSEKYSSFVNACLRQTDNIQPRETRFKTLYKESF